jgi:hypothetical protein
MSALRRRLHRWLPIDHPTAGSGCGRPEQAAAPRLPARAAAAPKIVSLCASLLVVLGLTGWTADLGPDKPRQVPTSGPPGIAGTTAATTYLDIEAPAGARSSGSGGQSATDRPQPGQLGFGGHDPTSADAAHASQVPQMQPTSAAAPDVAVRASDHGEFERVAFEWPEAVDYDVAQRDDRVVIAFGRPGRIDFSRVRDRFGHRLLEARAKGGDVTRQVALRVAPHARIRSFSLERDRIVVVDVFDGSAPQPLAAPAPSPKPPALSAESHEDGVAPSREVETAREHPANGTVPDVAVRVGDHGGFERVVFEWPEPIRHNVTRRGDQVVVAFGRPGRIDLAPVRGAGRLVVDAQAEGGQATWQVALRVLPDTEIRSFSLEDGRAVVIDVLDPTAARGVAQSAPDPERDSIRELRQAIARRDAVIENLLARVEELERKIVLSSGDLDRVTAGAAVPGPALGGAPLPPPVAQGATVAQASTGEPAQPAEPAAQPAPEPPAAGQSQGGGGTSAPAKPGQFEVVEEQDIDRALERTLVQTGVLLLPMGQVEVEPSFSYVRQEAQIPVLFTENGSTFIAEQQIRRNEFESGQILRVGLPFDSQIELGVPYRYVDQSAVTKVGGMARQNIDGSGQGFGDVRVGVAKTLLRENGGWWPDVVARVTWDTDTGKTSDHDILLGGGFNEIRGSLNAVKRQDPLAFVGEVSYETTFEHQDVKPGDEVGFAIGTVLAASPETSLRLTLGQRFVDNAQLDGEGIDGSDRVVGTATFGASVVLGRGVLLDVAADVGLTDDAPDYAVRTSLPIRFNLPAF